MTITAKFDGRCRNCGGRIAAGERIEWSRETGATHENARSGGYCVTEQVETYAQQVEQGMRDAAAQEADAEYEARKAPVSVAAGWDQTMELGSFEAIYKMFETAKSHLKYPKLRFTLDNGTTVMLKLAGAQSKFPGVVNVTNGGTFGIDNEWYGRITKTGQWQMTARAIPDGIVNALHALAQGPAAYVGEKGRLAGACCFCAKRLTDARSTTVGYGEICAGHYGLPWGEAKTTLEQVGAQQTAAA